MALNHSPSIVTNGLVLYLDAANRRSYPGSGTSWFDLSGNNNHGTLTNGPTFSSANGGGIVFDGTDDHVSFSSLPSGFQAGMTNYSISIWFKIKSNKEAPLLEMGTGSSDLQRIMFWLTGGTPNRLYAIGASTNQYRFSSINLSLNTLYNAVYTYDNSGTISKLYINNIQDTGLTNSNTNGLLTSLGNAFKICSDSVYGGQYIQHADIYSILLYTKTLLATEVAQNYNATKGRFGL